MKKCNECNKLAKELDTPWQRIRYWAFQTFFRWEIRDLERDFYTKGFSEGYKDGYKWGKEENDFRYVKDGANFLDHIDKSIWDI